MWFISVALRLCRTWERVPGSFLQLVGSDSADLCQQGWNSGTFFIVSASTQAELLSSATNSSFLTNTCDLPHFFFFFLLLLLPRRVSACLATVCGFDPTCSWVLLLVFFQALWKNGDFSYRSRVPTAGICLWWISWAPPSSIIVSNIPRKTFENYGAMFGVSAFQNIGTNR